MAGVTKTFTCKSCGCRVITTQKKLIESELCSDCYDKKMKWGNIMQSYKLLELLCFFLLAISFIFMSNGLFGIGFVLLLFFVPIGFITIKVYTNKMLEHTVVEISKDFTIQDILSTIEDVINESNWTEAVGPGQINAMKKKFGIFTGPVLSVSLSEKYNNTYELDLWVSSYNESSKGIPKISAAYPKMKDRIINAIAGYMKTYWMED